MQEHRDQVHWADGEPLSLASGVSKKLKSKDFMVVEKSSTTSTTISQVGWEEGLKRVVKIKKEGDGDEEVPDGTDGMLNPKLTSPKSNIKIEGKRLAEVK